MIILFLLFGILVLNWRFKYINECIYIVCENVWMSFYFYVFLFFVRDFSKACMLIPFAFAVTKRLWSKWNWRKKPFWLFFHWISRQRDWKQEDSMTYFKKFTWLNENQDLRQLSYDKYLANCLKWWSVYTILVLVYKFIYSYK